MTQAQAMDVADIWRAIDAHCGRVADLLADLSDEEWDRPSLCAGWTVRDVAAHLTLQRLRLRDSVTMMRNWRGNMDRTIAHWARRRAADLPTGQIVAEIRAAVGAHRPNVGVTPRETLIDILVHAQDIAVPLGRTLVTPPDAAAVATSRLLSMRWPPPPPSVRTVSRFGLSATDVAWSAGDGPQVRGPMGALLLVCCGRPAGLADLSGPGLAELTARLTA
jgi:uncharacterized protein (TIGR03083 family)